MRLLSSLRSSDRRSRSASPAPHAAPGLPPPPGQRSSASPAPQPSASPPPKPASPASRSTASPTPKPSSCPAPRPASASAAADLAAWTSKLNEAKARGTQATKLELAGELDEALQAYFDAGQSYLWLVAHYPSSPPPALPSQQRLKTQLSLLIKRGESIKAARPAVRAPQRNILSAESQDRVLRLSAVVMGHHLPSWEQRSLDQAVPLPRPPMSDEQACVGAQFRPAINGRVVYDPTALTPDTLVQDRVADCSTVAALQAMVLHDRRWGTTLVQERICPQRAGVSITSPNGVYAIKLFLNGLDRCAYVNDELPQARQDLVCARTLDGKQLWPGLMEKAYLCLAGQEGGYSFNGSDPGVDLRALSGWVPEHIDLAHGVSIADRSKFRPERAWKRIYTAFNRPGCLLTAGTPAGSTRSEDEEEAFVVSRGLLVTAHAYAVVDMYVTPTGERRITLLNPWSIERMKELYHLYADQALATQLEGLSLAAGDQQYLARTVDLGWNEFCSRMGSVFLNLDPALWAHKTTVHASWDLSRTSKGAAGEFATSKQFVLTVSGPSSGSEEEREGEVWVLLERHLPRAKAQGNHISLKLVETTAKGSEEAHERLVQARDTRQRVYWLDAPQCLHKIPLDSCGEERRAFLITASCVSSAASEQAEEVRFTLTILSPRSTELTAPELDLPHHVVLPGQWKGKSAGGSSLNPTFVHNPQWSITFPSQADVRVALHCSQSDALVAAHLVRSDGGRVSTLSAPTGGGNVVVVGSTGPYDSGLVSFSARFLPPGTYTVVVSTYDPGTEADFNVQLESTEPLATRFLPPEGSGLFARSAYGVWAGEEPVPVPLAAETDAGPDALLVQGRAVGSPSRSRRQYSSNPSLKVTLARAAHVQARLVPYAMPHSGPRPFANVTLFTPQQGELGAAVASSGAYTDALAGAVLPSSPVAAGEHRLVLSTFAPWTGAFVLHVYADRAFSLDADA